MNDNYPIRTYAYPDTGFPAALLHASLSPSCACVYMKGASALPARCVGIVGTRKASSLGISFAHACAAELASHGIGIISGLSYGIDAAAHRGALAGNGVTVAVLAHGLDTIYPPAHESLAEEILLHRGILLSEYPPNTPSLPYRFLKRNRIIAALSEATIVIEAPSRSGALATAAHATHLGKKVLVLAGSPSSPLYAGSHALIRSGARLCASIQDVCEDLGIPKKSIRLQASLSGAASAILNLLQREACGCSVDKIVEQTTLNPQDVHAAITELLLADAIIEDGISRYKSKQDT